MIDLTKYKSLNNKDYEDLAEELDYEINKYVKIIIRLEEELTEKINFNNALYNEYKKLNGQNNS